MSKRAFAAFLWFAATWFGYEVIWSLTGVPRIAGPVIAFAVAAFITVDPLGLFWPQTDDPDFAPPRATARQALETPVSPSR
jgi:hypothetical protein